MRMIGKLALLAALGACATTEVTNTWKDPQGSGATLRKVVIVGVSNQASVRRAFEDTFAQSLTDVGVQGVPSYTLIPKDGQIAEDALQKAIQDAGADGVLITRMVSRESDLVVTPSPMPPPLYGRRPYYYGYYSSAWTGYYEPSSVQQFKYIVAETTLFRAAAAEPAWSATTRTQEPEDVAKATAGFAKAVIPAMKKDGLF